MSFLFFLALVMVHKTMTAGVKSTISRPSTIPPTIAPMYSTVYVANVNEEQ